MPTEKRK